MKWISVEEQLPPPLQDVLAKPKHFLAVNGYINSAGKWTQNTDWVQIQGDATISAELDDVTHWMPLPDPPE